MSYLVPILGSLARQLPMIIILGVGIAMAASRWNQHPRASMLATIGCVVYLVMGLFSAIFFTVVPMILMESGAMDGADMGIVYTVAGVIISLIDAAALGLILAAVFAERARVQATPGVKAPLL